MLNWLTFRSSMLFNLNHSLISYIFSRRIGRLAFFIFLYIIFCYQFQYTEITEKYRGEEPKDKDWALSTPLYRAICDRKSSSSYEEAMKEYWLLCKLKEDYYDLEKLKGVSTSINIFYWIGISNAQFAIFKSSSEDLSRINIS